MNSRNPKSTNASLNPGNFEKSRQFCSPRQQCDCIAPWVVFETAAGTIAVTIDTIVEGRARFATLSDSLPAHLGERDLQQSKSLIDAESIGALFGIDATWFLTRAREGRIPHVRLGKYVRFDPDEIRDFFHRDTDRQANS